MTLRRFASSTLVTAGLLLLAGACGSRTGLFGAEQDLNADASARNEGGEDVFVGCKPGDFVFELALTQLMFAIDRSGSMAFTLGGVRQMPREQWRWSILQNSLAQTITTFDNQIAMGAKFFPEVIDDSQSRDPAQACRMESTISVQPARGNAQNILRFFDQTEPVGGTPTSEAIRVSAEALSASRGVARTIVLATDGAPNCNGSLDKSACTCTNARDQDSCHITAGGEYNCLDQDRTVETIRHTNEDLGIPVYVIGIGSTDRPDLLDVLDNMAVAGGRPRATGARRYYAANSQDELTVALETIRDSVANCTYLTPSAPDDPDSITVNISGRKIPHDPAKQNGWEWIDRRLGWLQFFGDACTRAQTAPTPTAIGGTIVCDDK